ncbi:DNA-binding transcriptional regulator, GntR family [Actinopolyspora mzabensis]|uniref:DNA-binding transcriptional regulator, GntR family n=1 Tax=Actinopolyspora mzabensis TaxID=995066 RepID=A0A1G9EMY4_ACTMZ|nr:GntR family transcriptional regulator [Actinopolyspora mzabensis]SDK77486.1 DNA-binding transcriptional regulator, GntR family [Actinopolyspora mzabensis]
MPLDVPALGGVDRNTLREQSLHKLREAISSGQLAPGTRLVETELSEALSVSRGTLREALRHLVQEGLVVTGDRGRLLVRALTTSEVRDIFAVRRSLETLAVETLCEMTERGEVVRTLRESLNRLRDTGQDLAELIEADLGFHRQLCELTGNETLVNSWQHISGLTRATISRSGQDLALRNIDWQRHLPIVDAIEAGDADRAREVVRTHMREATERIVRVLEDWDSEGDDRHTGATHE